MEQLKKPLLILNLAGELSSDLMDYFQSRGVSLVDPSEMTEDQNWTHVLTKDVHDFEEINQKYHVGENSAHIISLTKMDDLQNFSMNRGNLILDDRWFQGPMGAWIFDKYFQSYGGITLGDNYPAFKELGTFNITNPFNTGEYLDRMVHHAFENGIDGLTLKTYFDHIIMYITGLKKKGRVGLPFEVTYGAFEGVFATQIHFYARKLDIIDISSSLSSSISKKSEEYLLNVAVQSADFFDLSFMPEVKKIVITGLWTQDERIKFENRGLMFSVLDGGISLVKYESEGNSLSLVSNTDISDHTEKIIVPDNQLDEKFETVVSGSEDTQDEVLIIKGDKDLEELIQTVRGKFEEDKSVVRLSSNKLDIEQVAFRIAANVDVSAKEKDYKIRSLGTELPDAIKTGLFDFAKNLSKSAEDLDEAEIDLFQTQEIPKLIKETLKNSKPIEAASIETPEGIKETELKLLTANTEIEKLKSQLKVMASEVRILKETRNKLAEIQMKATQVANETTIKGNEEDDVLRAQLQNKLIEQKRLNDEELKKFSAILDKEAKLVADVRQEEIKNKRLQIEAHQKESYFTRELEKSIREVRSKDLILIKSKETFTKLLDNKEKELRELKSKTEQLSRALSTGPSQNQTILIKDLEKQNQNLTKQIEVYKVKISSLATNMQTSKVDDNLKDEARKLQMQNQQMKNQMDAAKKETEKQEQKFTEEITALRQEKSRLEQLVRKTTMESMKETREVKKEPDNAKYQQQEQELKRVQAQNQILDSQLKESSQQAQALEAKIVELTKLQKTAGSGDDGSKVKLAQLENSVKKLTQDVIESKTQLGEAKKETNKLRQEKTALQNQLDRLKKEADKAKSTSPKKPGGKAA